MTNLNKDKSIQSVVAAARLIKNTLNKIVENKELKAFSPDMSTLNEYVMTTTDLTLTKLRDKLQA
jgi:hypothetical protein